MDMDNPHASQLPTQLKCNLVPGHDLVDSLPGLWAMDGDGKPLSSEKARNTSFTPTYLLCSLEWSIQSEINHHRPSIAIVD